MSDIQMQDGVPTVGRHEAAPLWASRRLPDADYARHPAYGASLPVPSLALRTKALLRYTKGLAYVSVRRLIDYETLPMLSKEMRGAGKLRFFTAYFASMVSTHASRFFKTLVGQRKAAVPSDRPLAEAFKQDGYVAVRITKADTDKLMELTAPAFEALRARRSAIAEGRRMFDDNLYWMGRKENAAAYEYVEQLLAKEGIIDVVSSFLGRPVGVKHINPQLNDHADTFWKRQFPDTNIPDSPTTFMHIDTTYSLCKFMLYLTPVVTEEDGPFAFVRGTSAAKVSEWEGLTRRAVEYAGLSARKPETRAMFLALPKALQKKCDLGNDLVSTQPEAAELLANEVKFFSQDANGILFNPNGVHRGGMVAQGERLVLTVLLTEIERCGHFDGTTEAAVLKRMIGFISRRSAGVISGGVIVGLRAATLASKLVLAVLLATTLTPADVGTYGLVVAILSIAIVVVGLELYTQVNRELVTLPAIGRASLLRDQALAYLPLYGLAALVAWSAAAMGAVPADLAAILCSLIVLDHFSQEIFRTLIFLQRILVANIVLFLRAGAWCLVVVAMFWVAPGARSIWLVFLMWVAGGAASLAVGFFALRDLPWHDALGQPVNWRRTGERLARAIPFMVSAIAGLVTLFGDQFLIEYFAGRDAVGVYTLFSGFAVAVASLVTSAISHRFLPQVIAAVHAGRTETEQVLGRFLAINVTATATLSVFAALAGLPIVMLVGRPEYAAEIAVYLVLLLAMGVRAVADVPFAALYGMHADRRLLATNLLTAAVAVVLNLLLIPPFGLMGAALSAVISSLVLLGSQTFVAFFSWHQLGKIDGAQDTPPPEGPTDLVV